MLQSWLNKLAYHKLRQEQNACLVAVDPERRFKLGRLIVHTPGGFRKVRRRQQEPVQPSMRPPTVCFNVRYCFGPIPRIALPLMQIIFEPLLLIVRGFHIWKASPSQQMIVTVPYIGETWEYHLESRNSSQSDGGRVPPETGHYFRQDPRLGSRTKAAYAGALSHQRTSIIDRSGVLSQ